MVMVFQIILILALVIGLMGAIGGDEKDRTPMLGMAIASMVAFIVAVLML